MKMCITQLALVCCLLGTAFAKTEADIKTWFMERGVMCIKDHPVSDEEIRAMHEHLVPDSQNAKCFIACIFKNVEWMDDKGMFLEENAVKTAEQDLSEEPEKIENAKKLFASCKTVNDETYSGEGSECMRAASLAKCLVDNAPKMGFKLP